MDDSNTAWVGEALSKLASLRSSAGGWPYQPGNSAAVEPTVLAAFAQLTTGNPSDSDSAQVAANWLASIQREDGALGVTSDLRNPAWGTPYGMLLWAQLKTNRTNLERAASFLLGLEGRRLPRSSESGHDSTLAGWPWVSGTHSWLEPTAMSVLALAKAGYSDHERIKEALLLIEDRALTSGGWNHGNTVVFGTELRAQPGPTGLALLALAAVHAGSNTIEKGAAYLMRALPRIASPRALGWGTLGLSAWNKVLESSPELLAGCYARVKQSPTPMDLSLLILAAENETTRFFI